MALAETLRESLRYASHLFQQKNVELVWRVEDETARVVGDPELLRQVFLNLAMNGAQAMENGGQLEVRVAATDGAATVEFLDQGSGIDPDLLPKIFDPFITTRRKGTGLGLTIVHNIVTAHGGSVEIANRQDRQGARAAVEIPLAEAG
ncbi:MAG: Sensor protein ZraS [candidate division BRC1 bacterium ADurb.BinA364]|nr:MAG: Sensor protein ZraS [candidate division BRC1 bacterium ADurb.BinA364]